MLRPGSGWVGAAGVTLGGLLGIVIWGGVLGAVALLVLGMLVLAAPLVGGTVAAVVSVPLFVRSLRRYRAHRPRRWGRALLVGASLVAPLHLAATAVGAVVPDALDRLPAHQRAAFAAPISEAFPCHAAWPVTRVTRVEVAPDGREAEFTCAWSLLGWPRFDGWVSCVNGRWYVESYRDVGHVGACAPARPAP